VREVGTAIQGYNPIATIGLVMGGLFIVGVIIIVYLANKKSVRDIFFISAFILFLQYVLATTVHPWYSINVLIPGILAGLRFSVFWTGLIFLSYSFYGVAHESVYYVFVAVEYVVLAVLIVWEWKRVWVRQTSPE
jgi:hypothetical protein